MAYSRPTLQQIRARILSDLESGLSLVTPFLPKSFLRVLADVIAAAVNSALGFIVWVINQCFPDTAEAEYLDRWAAVWGLTRKDPSFATGSVTFSGSNGSPIDAGSVLIGPNGVEYTTNADATISGGSALVAITASSSGPAGNLLAGVTLSLASPLPGVVSLAPVAVGGLTGGADVESDADLRVRIEKRIQQAPQGGAKADYENWALEVPGVTRAWCFPLLYGLGTVGLTFAVDGSGTIPSPENVADVQAYVDAKKPVTAQLTVFAPVEKIVNFTIAVTPNTSAVKNAVQQELEIMLATYGQPGSTIPLSQIIQTCAGAEGETKTILSVPAADLVIATNEVAVMGVITWL